MESTTEMDKTLTSAEEAMLEKLVYVLSILEGMDKRIKALEGSLAGQYETFAKANNLLVERVKTLEDQVNGDGK
jgi:hypothetical protein